MRENREEEAEIDPNHDSSVRLRRASVGILTAVFAFLIAAWTLEVPESSVRNGFRVAGICFLGVSLIVGFFSALIAELGKGLERSDGPSEQLHFQMILITVVGFGSGFLCLTASISFIAAAVTLGSTLLGIMYVQSFFSAMLSEHASPPYGMKGSKSMTCYPPYVIVTKCRPNPGGELFREWVEIRNYWTYSTPIDRLRLIVRHREIEREYWRGSSNEVLPRFKKLRIHTGQSSEKMDRESKGIGRRIHVFNGKDEFQFSHSHFEIDPELLAVEGLTLELQVITSQGFVMADEVQVPIGSAPGMVLKRGFLCALGHSNMFDNAYKRS